MNTHFFTRKFILGCALVLMLASCSKEAIKVQPDKQANASKAMTLNQTLDATLLSETFESGTKAAYASASVTLSSGSWTLDDALIGNLAADLKDGTKSVRMRNTGTMTTNFDIAGSSSAMTLTLKHGIYTGDNASTWQLFVAANGGSYTQVGSTITSTTTLQTATFTIPAATSFRISIRKVSGGSNRINIDDISITDSSSGTGGGGTGSGPVPGDDDNMLLGNPSGAVANTNAPTNYLMDAQYYIESYNSTEGKPNWVSWHIQSSDLGSTPRQDDYRANTSLPSGWYQVGSSAYSGSGFDRGHYCPSGDRTSSVAANQATFLMTNMMPQAPNNNEVTWESLEDYTRDLVTGSGDEVYVIAGSYGQGGTGSNGGTTNTVASGHVVVPSYTWKVVVVLSNGNNDLSRISSSTRVISVIMPNINTINSNWKTYRTSLAAIESATGYTLLSNVPSAVKSALENVVDNQ